MISRVLYIQKVVVWHFFQRAPQKCKIDKHKLSISKRSQLCQTIILGISTYIYVSFREGIYPKQPGPFFIAQFMSRHRVVASFGPADASNYQWGSRAGIYLLAAKWENQAHSSRVRGDVSERKNPSSHDHGFSEKIGPCNSSYLSNTFLKFNSEFTPETETFPNRKPDRLPVPPFFQE